VFDSDLASGNFHLEWGADEDLERANALNRQYRDLRLGLADAVVLAVAERLRARTIATLDLRHFAAVKLARPVRLIPRDRL
jgi:predicted nucleic acid-binding protein